MNRIYIEGALQTREYTPQSGEKRYTTEVILRPFNSAIVLLDRKAAQDAGGETAEHGEQPVAGGALDDIPF